MQPAEKIFFILWGHGFGIDDFDPFLDQGASAGDLGRGSDINFRAIIDFHFPFAVKHAPVQDATALACRTRAKRRSSKAIKQRLPNAG
jgi:hypothetical protein